MKKLKVIQTAVLLIAFIFILTGNVSAQFPTFTLSDTGAIGKSVGHHVASGCLDYDNDGDMDLIITNSSGYNYQNHPNLLFKNERNNFFTQVTNNRYTSRNITVGLPGPFGDIDNNGLKEILLPNWLGTDNAIFHTTESGNIYLEREITQLSGTSSVLFDLNNDSFLDIILFHEGGSRVFYNTGTGEYTDFTNLNIPCQNASAVLHNIALGDADNDGDFDLYIGYTDFAESGLEARNEFFLNNGSGSFERYTNEISIVEDEAMTPNSNWVDYDNDGDMDLYVLNTFNSVPSKSMPGVLYENKGSLNFVRHIIEPEKYADAHRISSVWGDLDNDADLDLYITIEKNPFNGHISSVNHNLLMLNNGDGTFTEITTGILAEQSSHTTTFEDFDNDGDLDVLLVRFSWANNGTNNLCINEGNDNSWLILTCEGTNSNKSAYGARVVTKSRLNGKTVKQTREITPISGHATYVSTRVHFGFGNANIVDTLTIHWPSGKTDTYTDVKANQFYHAIEDSTLEIDFKATNYIQLSPNLDTVVFTESGGSKSIDLKDHYKLITGDTVPILTGDTLEFALHGNENHDVVNATLDGSVLTLNTGAANGNSVIQVIASAGFTRRMDQFTVSNNVLENLPKLTLANDTVSQGDTILATSNKDGTIYLVIVGTTPENIFIQTGRVRIIDSMQVTANNQIEFLTNNLNPKDYLIYAKDIYGQFSDASRVSVDVGTGIVQNRTKYLNIFPNPANGVLYLEVPAQFQDEFDVKMISVTGKLIFQKTGHIEKIDISGIPPGVYLISVKSKDFVSTKKIIKR